MSGVITLGTSLRVDLARADPPAFEARTTLTGDWFGARSEIEDHGVSVEARLVMDGIHNFSGGINRGWGFHHLFEAGITLDLEHAANLDGATIFAGFYTNNGDQLSSDIVGDLQIFSNIKERHRTELNEFWYEQWLLDDRLRLKVGKVDANEEFAFAEYGSLFTQSSMGFSPTIFVFPSFPDPAMSVNLFAYPSGRFYAGFGVYDGALVRGVPTGKRGPSLFFHSFDDLFLIGELGVRWSGGQRRQNGRLALGGWHHPGEFAQFDGGARSGTSGFYAVLDQTLWHRHPADDNGPRIGMFLQYGYADDRVSEFAHHLGGGVEWTGPLPGREADVMGFGASWVRLSGEEGAGFDVRYEVDFEVFYRIQITPWLFLQPDLHVILNPGGTADREHAVVGLLRVEIVF